jgi:hypothetical protein
MVSLYIPGWPWIHDPPAPLPKCCDCRHVPPVQCQLTFLGLYWGLNSGSLTLEQHPQPLFFPALVIFQIGSPLFPGAGFTPWSTYLHLPPSWDDRNALTMSAHWLRWGFTNFLPGLASKSILLSSACQVAWITRVRHQARQEQWVFLFVCVGSTTWTRLSYDYFITGKNGTVLFILFCNYVFM